MDSLVPVFKTHDWIVDEHKKSELIFLKETGAFSFGAEVCTDVSTPLDLCVSVSTSILCEIESAASENSVNARLRWLEIAARKFFSEELFMKRMATFWFPEAGFVQLAVSNPWVGHQSMLAMPNEVFEISADAPCNNQMRFLQRIQIDVCNALAQPDDSDWANEYQTFHKIVSPTKALFFANDNSEPVSGG